MSLSPRARLLAGFLFANMAIALVAAVVLLNRPASPPQIQGVLLPEARALPDFQLVDHHDRAFTNKDLQGRWHLVSYGFTTCPDICPTTLSQLAEVSEQLRQQGHSELRVLFYTVDHRRDTVAQLASYVPFFDPEFLGLTHIDDSANPHLPFEQGLGIVAQLLPATGPDIDPASNEYQVVHGVKLFLVNPQGELQAIFEPDETRSGIHTFTPQTIERDYLAIRQYLG
jgi:protein SCO1/2